MWWLWCSNNFKSVVVQCLSWDCHTYRPHCLFVGWWCCFCLKPFIGSLLTPSSSEVFLGEVDSVCHLCAYATILLYRLTDLIEVSQLSSSEFWYFNILYFLIGAGISSFHSVDHYGIYSFSSMIIIALTFVPLFWGMFFLRFFLSFSIDESLYMGT